MMKQKIKNFFFMLIHKEACPKKLVLSFCMGVYIAFCPFVGLHTAMVFLFSWLFTLNAAIMLAVSCLINNPWTMVPVYAFGHIFGQKLLFFCGADGMHWNPSWLTVINNYIVGTIGLGRFSLTAFLVGGNALGVILSILFYPILKKIVYSYFFKKTLLNSKKV